MKPCYEDEQITLHHGDSLAVLREMPDSSVDAVVTDPPYGLGFMGKEWDALPPGEEWARECLRVLKPGGHLLAKRPELETIAQAGAIIAADAVMSA